MESQVHDCRGDSNPTTTPPHCSGLGAGGTAVAAWSAGVPAAALGSPLTAAGPGVPTPLPRVVPSLTAVFTSQQALHWQENARGFYCKHFPSFFGPSDLTSLGGKGGRAVTWGETWALPLNLPFPRNGGSGEPGEPAHPGGMPPPPHRRSCVPRMPGALSGRPATSRAALRVNPTGEPGSDSAMPRAVTE